MKKILILLGLVIILNSCSIGTPSSSHFSKMGFSSTKIVRDGSTIENAVIIEQTNEKDAKEEQKKWMDNKFHIYTIVSKSIISNDKKPYELIVVKLEHGTEIKVYFDISNFYVRK